MHAVNTPPSTTFEIVYDSAGRRFVRCEHCWQLAGRSIVPHLKRQHPHIWQRYVQIFAELRRQGYSYKKIMWHFDRAFSWTVVERALAEAGVSPGLIRAPRYPLEPEHFKIEKTTVWSFPVRGKWAVHDSSYRGNWAPEVPRNLVLRYSKPGDLVLDPFVGGGTTAIEAILLGRNFIGLDVNSAALAFTRRKLRRLKSRIRRERGGDVGLPTVRLFRGDARRMRKVADETVDLVCAHPPYMDIVEYTRRDPADLSTITDPDRFIREMRKVAHEIVRCLKPGGVLTILIGDVRRNGRFVPLGMRILDLLMDMLDVEDVVIKAQHNVSSTHFYQNKEHSFLRIAHEYLLVMRKPALKAG